MKRVEVIWRDITSDDGWHTPDEADKFISDDEGVVCHIGYLYEEDENQLVLIDSYFKNKDLFGGIHKIPKGCIVSITEI